MLTNTERQQIVEEVNAGTYGIDEALDDIAAAQKGEEVRKALYAEALVLNREGHAGSTDMIARQKIANLQTSVNGQISTLRTEVGDDINDLETALNNGLATQNGKIAAQNATIANVVANYNVEYGSTELWASTGETGALAAGTTVTLSEDVSHFDYIDIYSFCGNSNVLDTVPVDAKLQSNAGYALRWVNLSDPGSGSYKAYVRIIETRLHIIGTTLTIDHQVTYRNGEEVNISGAEITQSNRSTYVGELGIMKIVGRKITANTELEDVRIGADGTEYASAGQAVRAQVTALESAIPAVDSTLSTQGAAADAKAVGDELTELNGRLNDFESDTFEIVTGKNLYNPEDTTVGFLLANGSVSTTGSYSAYLTSGFIPIENNTTYFFTERNAVEAITSTRYSSLLYSEDKTPIAESYQNVDATSGIAIVVNDATAKYMRVSVHYWEGKLLQVEKGESATSYQPYSKAYKLIAELGDAPTAQVVEIINNSGLLVTEIGRNLVNPENLVEGAVQSTGVISTAGSWATYSTSDFIPLDANTDYVFSTFNATTGNSTTNRKTLLLYDSSKTVINNTYQNVDGAFQFTFNSSDNAKFVRVSSWASVLFQLEKGTTRTPYAPYKADVVLGVGLGETPMEQAQSSNILYGKKWAVCGDSFTNGATTTIISDGKYAGRKFTYPYLIGNRNNMDIVKFFEGGRTLAYPSDGTFLNSITNPSADYYYQNIPTDVDYITVYLGINDSQHTGSGTTGDGEDGTGVVTLGSIDDTGTSTYYGAWNTILTWLITNRPNAHIGIIVTNGLSQSKADWRTAQINIANKYGIPYIDLNGDSRTPAMIRTINQNIPSAVKTALINKWAVDPSSNTHPNDAAHEFESTFIENFLRGL